MAHIATACGRSDLFAIYGNVKLPVIGFTDQGHAIVQKPDGRTGSARQVHVRDDSGQRLLFERVEAS